MSEDYILILYYSRYGATRDMARLGQLMQIRKSAAE